MRELVERRVGVGRSVTVSVAESPLGWLRSRGMVDARQFEAGERLRGDYETASLGARVTMRWPARAGRLVLTLALDRLADHYRLP
jgi:hypothetical protein